MLSGMAGPQMRGPFTHLQCATEVAMHTRAKMRAPKQRDHFNAVQPASAFESRE